MTFSKFSTVAILLSSVAVLSFATVAPAQTMSSTDLRVMQDADYVSHTQDNDHQGADTDHGTDDVDGRDGHDGSGHDSGDQDGGGHDNGGNDGGNDGGHDGGNDSGNGDGDSGHDGGGSDGDDH